MESLINLFPLILLGMMCLLTLVLLPMLHDDPAFNHDDRQRTDKIQLPVRDDP